MPAAMLCFAVSERLRHGKVRVRHKVTIDDIARESGASRTTVSLVLREKPGIGAETRQRVLAVAQSLGYERKSPASAEPGQAVRNIALILRSRIRDKPDGLPGVNNFYSWVLAGVEAAARRARMNLLYTTLPVDETNDRSMFPDHLLVQRLDGILLVGSFRGGDYRGGRQTGSHRDRAGRCARGRRPVRPDLVRTMPTAATSRPST